MMQGILFMSLAVAAAGGFRKVSGQFFCRNRAAPLFRRYTINASQVPQVATLNCHRLRPNQIPWSRAAPSGKPALLNLVRHESSNSDEKGSITRPPKRSLPILMEFPEIVWPSILKSIRNWILINFIIRPYFDREFNLLDFVAGTKHALQVVSAKISEGDISSLAGLVAFEAILELRKSISQMNMAQRSELMVRKDDIFLTFPYQVGIMLDESDEKVQKIWVEITMVFHVMKGLKDMQEKRQTPPLNLVGVPEYRDRISICNYRFIKEFTQGNESDWTINVINHFKPSDYIDQ